MADHPKIADQTTVKSEGATSTPRTNSRMLRPLEMRARTTPMNGAQVTVQAQEKTVHPACQPQPPSSV